MQHKLSDSWIKNDRYQQIRRAIDRRVIAGYKLFKNNYVAFDLLNGGAKYAHLYEQADVQKFVGYMEHQLSKVEAELNKDEVKEVFLQIYANPVVTKELLELGQLD